MDGRQLVDKIVGSADWALARDWGEPRPGHPEGTVGRHVLDQVIPFIDRWYFALPEYWDLVALSYLHDIGKPVARYENGRLVGDPHSVISAKIAEKLGAPDRLVQVIYSNDRAYSHWRKLRDKKGRWTADRWTEGRRQKFVTEFGRDGLDLRLLVLFHRADNGYRRPGILDETVDSVVWFERLLVAEGLLNELPIEGKDQKLEWRTKP